VKVSVILTAYNRPDYLKQAIDSYMIQDYVDKELIIVNDGSDNDIYSVVKKYLKNDNVYYIEKKNVNVAHARNVGMLFATGDYVTCLDDDDMFYDAQSLSIRADALKESDVVYTDAEDISAGGEHMKDVMCGPITKQGILSRDTIYIGTMMWKSGAIKSVGGFPEDIRFGEDWEFKINCVYRLNVKPVNKKTLKYRRHSGNKSFIDRVANQVEWDTMINRCKKRYGVS
jgi:glycosyltransferase involved in cell wall biosynthesis